MESIQSASCPSRQSARITKTRYLWLLLAALLVSFAGRTQAAIPFQITNQFELDGNIAAQLPNPPDDWLLLYNGGANNGGSPSLFTGIITSEPGNVASDDGFTTGSKIDQQMVNWQWVIGQVNDKTDLDNVAIALYNRTFDPGTGADVGPGTNLFFMADLVGDEGDATLSLWLFKNKLSKTTNAAGDGGGFTNNNFGLHSNGDILLESQFVNGGGVADIQAFGWTNGALHAIPIDGIERFGAVNSNNITPPWPYNGKGGSTQYLPTQFFEGGAALNAFATGFDPCFSSFLFATRNSQSQGSSLSDFVLGSFATQASLTPTNATVCTNNVATLCANSTGGIPPFKYVWTGPNGFTSTNTGTSSCIQATNAGNYVLTVTGDNGCVAGPITNTVSVVGTAPCSITGPAPVCPGSLNTYTGAVGVAAYAWSISGNGAIEGPANNATVNVRAGSTCNASFTLQLITTAGSGCTNICSQAFLVNDTTKPTINCSTNKSVECGVAWTFDPPSASDNCGGTPIVTIEGTITNLTCGATFFATRTWRATDACGNTNFCSQVVTIVDTTPPAITTPAGTSHTTNCPNGPTFGAPLFTDVCQGIITPVVVTTTNVIGCTNVITRTWTAIDGCNNTNSTSQTVTVIDLTAPAVATPAGGNHTTNCPSAPSFTAPTFNDACKGAITPTAVTTTNTFGCTNVITRTWTANDGCGNTTNVSQVVTVIDTTAPAVATPAGANHTTNCPSAPSFTAPTFNDACKGAITPSAVTTTNTFGCTNVITRTWTADDGCGNTTNVSQVVTVIDTVAPAIQTPAGLSHETNCPNPPFFTAPTFNDLCKGSAITVTASNTTNTFGCTNVITRTWRADDGCGNTNTSASQTVTLVDTTAPTVSTPAGGNHTTNCPAAPSFTAPVFSDLCGALTLSTNTSTNVFGCTNVITRTWTANDGCGNSTNASQVITVIDVTAPAVATPAGGNHTTNCPSAPSFTAPTFNDACKGPITPSAVTTTNTFGCTNVITRTWTANDGCGNTTNVSQVITVIDVTAPAVATPAGGNHTTNCPSAPSFTAPTFNDACKGAITPSAVTTTNTFGCTNVITRTWTANDGCGNTTNVSQVITVIDTTAPVVATPAGANHTTNCPSAPSFTAPTFNDACKGAITPSAVTTTNTFGCTNVITRTWTADDGCGNTTNVSQVVTVIDTTAPAIATPAGGNHTTNCPSAPSFTAPTFNDACKGAITPSAVTTTNVFGCTNVITRTWTANDGCGNTTNVSQVITVIDTTAPAIATPAGGSHTTNWLSVPSFTAPTFTDACKGPIIPTEVTTTNAGTCTNIVTRTWTADDGCGNTNTATQVITRINVTPPQINAVDRTVGCFEFSTNLFLAFVTNAVLTIDSFDVVSTNAFGQTVHQTTFRAFDGCNTTIRVQTILVDPCPVEFCSLTQGFYGNAKGKYQGEPGMLLLNRLLSTNDVQLGGPGLIIGKTNGAYLVISNNQASCIVRRLPAGGPSSAMPPGKHVFLGTEDCGTDLPLDKQGNKFRNNLLGQQITLSLNIRLDGNLGGVLLTSTMCTLGDSKDDIKTFSIDASVLTALDGLGGRTVKNLVELGNRALAGLSTGGASLGSIQSAVEAINSGFDECRFLITCPPLQ